jgi:prolycopene isomerase
MLYARAITASRGSTDAQTAKSQAKGGAFVRFHNEAKRDAYDVVVVGAGIGGLTVAALLARMGRSVLVVERHDRVGGYAHAFRRGRYLFDSAVHLVGGCERGSFEGSGMIHELLSALEVRDHCQFERIDPCYAAVYPDFAVRAPCDLDEFVNAHADKFPGEKKGLRQFLQECLGVRQETRRAAELTSPYDVMKSPDRFPTLLRYRKATHSQVLDANIESPRLKSALGSLWPYTGLPPSRVSFLYFAPMLMSYIADGAYYCKGSFQRFANALAAAIETRGGEILLRSSVRRICIEGGRVRGIALENGQTVETPLVISNADATQTVEELVGEAAFPRRYIDELRSRKFSLSAFVTYVAAELPMEKRTTCHETFFFPSADHDESFRGSAAGDPSWFSVTVPTLADPGLAPEGIQLLVLTTLVPHQVAAGWRAEKEHMTKRMLTLADRQLGGLRERIRYVESGTPRTMERYTRNSAGAIYGWEPSPEQVGPARLGARTPVEGLQLVGHWTQPGGGIYGVVSSGIQAARSALGLPSEAELWRSL